MDKEELAEKLDSGDLAIEDILDFFKILGDIGNENEEIQDEVEGWDRVLLFDPEGGQQITMTCKDGKFTVEEGAKGTPDITLGMTADVAVGILSGETDATSAYMAGDLKVTGPLPDAIKFRTIIELIREELED